MEITNNYNLPTLDEFFETFQDFEVECSKNGLSTNVCIKMKLIDFLRLNSDELYVFHNAYKDKKMFKKLIKMIPPLKLDGMRIARIYVGNEGTGSHIHNHSVAVNYLIDGVKVWILFPKTRHNTSYLTKNNMLYGSINQKPLEWFLENEEKLKANLENVEIKLQHKNQVFTVPDSYYHGVYNLTEVCGITYSWF